MSRLFEGFSIFDDKGEVKRLVDHVVRSLDPDVTIGNLRKIDFSYIFTLSRLGRTQEVELTRSEIDASWGWRNGNVDETLGKRIRDAIQKL